MSATDRSGRWLVLSASMGGGHDQVADELTRRLRDLGHQCAVADLLGLLPLGVGRALRSGYAAMLARAPWLYEFIFTTFFLPRSGWSPGVFPLDVLAGRAVRAVVASYQPDVVVSTFHLAGQVVGRLRGHGLLGIPSVVAITEPAAHLQWLHPATDLFLSPYPWVSDCARERTRADVLATGPLVDGRFTGAVDPGPGRRAMRLEPGQRAVLISSGSWGVGQVVASARALTGLPGLRPVVLCGHNDALRAQLSEVSGCGALGWRNDLPEIFAASAALVDQSGGSTCAEAFAAGLPVVVHRPLPGHGKLGAEALSHAGLVSKADSVDELRAQVRRLAAPGHWRAEQLARAAAVFAPAPAQELVRWWANLPPSTAHAGHAERAPAALSTWLSRARGYGLGLIAQRLGVR